MISSKLLVFRGPRGALVTETVQESIRRKKSCGELFQNGYRVKSGPGQTGDGRSDSQGSFFYCLHVLSKWGKTSFLGNFYLV